MKRTVLTFGLISGGMLSLMLALTYPFHDQIGFEAGTILGYSSMVAAFLLIYFGVRSYRDNVMGGAITFGQGLKAGLLIMLVASLCYVATWQVIYYGFAGDEYARKYQTYVVVKAREDGASQADIDKKAAEMQRFVELYRNPLFNAAITMIEPLPVGLLFALVSAGILRRRREDADATSAPSTA